MNDALQCVYTEKCHLSHDISCCVCLPRIPQAYDAYVERMLMSLVLVRDQVEQSRFAIKPYALRSDVGVASAADTLVGAAEDIAAGQQLGKVCESGALASGSAFITQRAQPFAAQNSLQRPRNKSA